jgi:hypothetical protein
MIAATLHDARIELEKVAYDVLNPEGIEFGRWGYKFDTSGLETWARLHVQFGSTRTLEQGVDDPLGIREGMLNIMVYQLPSTDTEFGERICILLENAFRYKDFDGIYCEEPYSSGAGLDSDGAWVQHNVTIPFWTWVGK